jgi:hypothetical protein
MPANRYSSPPMTLANMRENGVRSLSVTCALVRFPPPRTIDGNKGEFALRLRQR